LRSVAPHRSGCIQRAAAFILVCRLLLPIEMAFRCSDATSWITVESFAYGIVNLLRMEIPFSRS
jgi:hypothetical protein